MGRFPHARRHASRVLATLTAARCLGLGCNFAAPPSTPTGTLCIPEYSVAAFLVNDSSQDVHLWGPGESIDPANAVAAGQLRESDFDGTFPPLTGADPNSPDYCNRLQSLAAANPQTLRYCAGRAGRIIATYDFVLTWPADTINPGIILLEVTWNGSQLSLTATR